MKEFNIDPAYLTDVTIREEWNTYTKDGRIPTPDEMLEVLAGKGNCSITRSENHPEFTKLHKQLIDEGFIQAEYRWVNGDRVLKSFKLNGLIFEEGAQFSSAMALGVHWQVRQNHPQWYRAGYW